MDEPGKLDVGVGLGSTGPAPPVTTFGPVREMERVSSVDILRGVAVLGILVMNIQAFGDVWPSYTNPTRGAVIGRFDMVTWWVTYLLFEFKFMTIFSMLFGAGLGLMAERATARGSSIGGIYYRRLLWLAIFGLAHAYLIWYGDILVWYAVSGTILYPLRRLRPATLLVTGSIMICVFIPLMLLFSHFELPETKAKAEEAIAARAAGEELTEEQSEAIEAWRDMHPDAARIQEEIDVYRGASWIDQVVYRAPRVFEIQTLGFLIFGWRIIGLMLIGIALVRMDVLSARGPARLYGLMVLIGYPVGVGLVALGARAALAADFDFMFMKQRGFLFNYFGSLLVALAHVGVVMLVVRTGALGGLTSRLAAVGRMALTSYLSHSLICTTLFYGWGFGLFATLTRFQLMGVVLGIFLFQVSVSPIWLRHFRFGPAEWLWRSLTYGKLQPMRIGDGT